MKTVFLGALLVLTACTMQGPPGLNGVNGTNGSSCSVSAVAPNNAAPNGGSLIQCADGT